MWLNNKQLRIRLSAPSHVEKATSACLAFYIWIVDTCFVFVLHVDTNRLQKYIYMHNIHKIEHKDFSVHRKQVYLM